MHFKKVVNFLFFEWLNSLRIARMGKLGWPLNFFYYETMII